MDALFNAKQPLQNKVHHGLRRAFKDEISQLRHVLLRSNLPVSCQTIRTPSVVLFRVASPPVECASHLLQAHVASVSEDNMLRRIFEFLPRA